MHCDWRVWLHRRNDVYESQATAEIRERDARLRSRDPRAFNEVLRLPYNFAGDAKTFIELIVSICDLKPVVLWGTIGSHFALSEAFRALPWMRSRNKASLKKYVDT